MRIGISVAHCGGLARPAAVSAAARAAEQLGYSSVWVCDSVLDPTAVLAATAAITSRVRLGAVLRVEAGGDPAALARALATVDVLSEGRLTVVLEGADDVVDRVLDAVDGPPVLLGGASAAALDRVARRAGGWSPAGLPVDVLAPGWTTVRDLAVRHGRDPDRLQLVVRAGVVLADVPLDADRRSYNGDVDQVADDVEATSAVGADEIVLRLNGDLSLDEALDGYARIAEAAELRARAAHRA
jgi:alkanesulfonate monooxygenase SsuD/methylene tetrahydromethanopterin reductase-like flavin-dependent oxidoreductase (luciferase family)